MASTIIDESGGGDRTDIATWEANDIPSGTLTESAVAEVRDTGTDLTDGCAFSGTYAATSAFRVIVRPEAGSEHAGKLGAGARITPSFTGTSQIFSNSAEDWVQIEGMQMDQFDGSSAYSVTTAIYSNRTDSEARYIRNIACDSDNTANFRKSHAYTTQRDASVLNNLAYNCSGYGIEDLAGYGDLIWSNNTFFDMGSSSGNEDTIETTGGSNGTLTNNVVMDPGGSGACYSSNFSSHTTSQNASSDTTGDTGHISLSSATEFEDHTGSPPDFTPASGQNLENAGDDEGTADQGNIDLNNVTRGTGAGVWDIGCLERVTAAAAARRRVRRGRRR